MNKKTIVISTLCLVLVVALPAQAIVAGWVQRLIIILQQVTQIGHQTTQIGQFAEKLEKAREQIQMVKDLKDSARDGLNTLLQPFTSLVSGPTALVGDTMNWGNEFRGNPRRAFDAAKRFAQDGRSLREGWHGRLSEADQVSESDILTIYGDLSPEVSEKALEAWKRRREQADTQLVLDHTVSDAAGVLAQMLKETQGSIEKLRQQKNTSATALAQAQVTGLATQGEILTAMAQLQALQAGRQAAQSYEKEIERRQAEAEYLAERRRQKQVADALFRPDLLEAGDDRWRESWRPKIFSGRPDGPIVFGD